MYASLGPCNSSTWIFTTLKVAIYFWFPVQWSDKLVQFAAASKCTSGWCSSVGWHFIDIDHVKKAAAPVLRQCLHTAGGSDTFWQCSVDNHCSHGKWTVLILCFFTLMDKMLYNHSFTHTLMVTELIWQRHWCVHQGQLQVQCLSPKDNIQFNSIQFYWWNHNRSYVPYRAGLDCDKGKEKLHFKNQRRIHLQFLLASLWVKKD